MTPPDHPYEPPVDPTAQECEHVDDQQVRCGLPAYEHPPRVHADTNQPRERSDWP